MKKIYIIALIIAIAFGAGCERNIPSDFNTDSISAPKAPSNLSIDVGDNQLVLHWTIDNSGSIKKYFIYRDIGDPDSVELLDSTTSISYADVSVQNGIRYFYKVSALSTSNIEGYKSSSITGIPGIFSIVINNEAEFTNVRSVSINSTAPERTSHIMLSNSIDFSASKWQNYGSSISWELSEGDGVKSVYARFKDSEGNESGDSFSDDIELDTRAQIDTFYIVGNLSAFASGDDIHFVMDAGESGGTASVSIDNVATIDLFDNGSNGDQTANDGVYETIYHISPIVEASNSSVSVEFRDRAGNSAPAGILSYFISISNLPEAPTLSAAGAGETQIDLSWVGKTIPDFEQFRLYRSNNSGVSESSKLLTIITNQKTSSYTDSDLEPGTTYYYRLYIYDNTGLSDGSNVVSKVTEANEVPKAVMVAIEVRENDLHLTWTRNHDDDFDSYRIYRSTSSIPLNNPDDGDLLVIENTQSTTSFTDSNATAGVTYFYRIYVYDGYGQSAGSNEVSGQVAVVEP